MAVASADRCGQVGAGLFAAAADPGGDAAVLVVRGVTLALGGTAAAGRCAGLDRRSHGAAIGLGLPGHGSAGRPASVGAVEAEANGANQLPHGLKGWIREAPPPSSQTT